MSTAKGPGRLLKAFYIFVARIDDDKAMALHDPRLQEHCHLMRQELRELYPDGDLDHFLPKPAEPAKDA